MSRMIIAAAAATLALTFPASADERVVCTLALEVGTTDALIREGSCDERMSPASTFKVAISLMGFDSGILTAADAPEWPFQDGYADWNPKWKQATTPKSWMQDSVVWFSQRTSEQLGPDRFAAYVDDFDYGNEDVAGDKGTANGLTRSWLSSSLQISPEEQVAFLTRMLEGKLPVSAQAVQQTAELMDNGEQNGWHVYGKTGAGMPFGADGEWLKGQPFGWYVGWAENEDRKIAFARLIRFSERPEGAPGPIARDGLTKVLFAPGGPLH